MRVLIVALMLAAAPVFAQDPAASAQPPPTIEAKTAGMQALDGYFPLYWDETAGTLWLEIPRFDVEFLYITGLSAGLGSNDIGLDRGQIGGSRIVTFRRVGPKVLLVQPNYDYRATSPNPDERLAVADAFAQSVLWGFTVAAESDGRVLVDATEFALRDVHGVVRRLRPASYRIDRSRSALYLPRTKAFPSNTEIDVTLTFVSDDENLARAGGGQDRGALTAVVPTPETATVRQHQSLVELPDDGYRPRAFDPRAGFGGISYQDYAAPLGESMTKRFIRRHRLEKGDPAAEVGAPVEPIVYYLDRGAPDPIRSALLEGAGWWNQAFEAAGYRNAFRVEMLPEDADPLDVRYNVIQWVHRSTRGWSYGNSVTDPRTGEIIKGHVTIGSLRARQDYLIFEGLLSPYATGTETPPELAETVLARLRQLAAHEVGHTLGLGHNYYDSRHGQISVMDYPHPLVTLGEDGAIDLSRAYGVGIGEWDKVAITYGYRDFPEGTDEAGALADILNEAWARDVLYLTNQDIDVHPKVDQWAHGTDPAAELERVMNVRRAALDRFGEAAITRGTPLALLEEALVPLYLHHRYQVDAAASAVGGVEYIYAMRGDGRTLVGPVPGAAQRAALDALAATLDPAALALPRSVVDRLPPRPPGYGRHRELFARFTGPVFDPVAPAMAAADHTITALLRPDRAARLVTQQALDGTRPGLGEAIDALVAATFDAGVSDAYAAEVNRAVRRVLVDRLTYLAGQAPMSQVRAVATDRLAALRDRLSQPGGTNTQTGAEARAEVAAAHNRLLAADIQRFLDRPAAPVQLPARPEPPPGAPIGSASLDLGCGIGDELEWRDPFFPPLFP